MVRTVPPILIKRMVDTRTDLSFETSLLVIIILQLQYLYIYYIYLRVHCQDNLSYAPTMPPAHATMRHNWWTHLDPTTPLAP